MVFLTLVFLALTIFYWSNLQRKNQFIRINFLTNFIIFICNIYLFTFLSSRWLQYGYVPLSNLYESLLFLVWCLTTLQLVIVRKTANQMFNAVLTPVEVLVSGLTCFLPHQMQMPAKLMPALQSNWLVLHVSMMIVSYAILILGSLLSVILLIITALIDRQEEYYQVNYNNTSGINPEFESSVVLAIDTVNWNRHDSQILLLTNLDIWSYRLIGLGHIALTLGILAGAIWANESWGSYWSWDPKETWSLITWIIFTVYLHVRLINNWKGIQTTLIGSVGFSSIWVSYLGVNFLASGLHSYGWIK